MSASHSALRPRPSAVPSTLADPSAPLPRVGRAALYARVSTRGHGQDVEVQLAGLRQVASQRGWRLRQWWTLHPSSRRPVAKSTRSVEGTGAYVCFHGLS